MWLQGFREIPYGEHVGMDGMVRKGQGSLFFPIWWPLCLSCPNIHCSFHPNPKQKFIFIFLSPGIPYFFSLPREILTSLKDFSLQSELSFMCSRFLVLFIGPIQVATLCFSYMLASDRPTSWWTPWDGALAGDVGITQAELGLCLLLFPHEALCIVVKLPGWSHHCIFFFSFLFL